MSNDLKSGDAINTLPELLAHALAMETEAAERYGELADQMETHRKAAVAAIFRRLEKAEQEHLDDLTERCSKFDLPHYAPWDYHWSHSESPEAIDITKVHYHLSVRGAVLLALEHERKATAFYAGVAQAAADAEVRTLALHFADEERQHIVWLEACLAGCGPADDTALDDPDPPLSQE
jgi:rubrerythrin